MRMRVLEERGGADLYSFGFCVYHKKYSLKNGKMASFSFCFSFSFVSFNALDCNIAIWEKRTTCENNRRWCW